MRSKVVPHLTPPGSIKKVAGRFSTPSSEHACMHTHIPKHMYEHIYILIVYTHTEMHEHTPGIAHINTCKRASVN